MVVRDPCFVIQSDSHSAELYRQMLMGAHGSPFGAFTNGLTSGFPNIGGGGGHGVAGASDFKVKESGTPNLFVQVQGGNAFIRGTENNHQGVYEIYNDADVQLTVPAADGTNPRKDLVILKVQDAAYSGAANTPLLAYVQGTAAASPVDPSLAAHPNALILARVDVPALDTTISNAQITDLRPMANAIGGILPLYNAQLAGITGDLLTEGRTYIDKSNDRLLISDGAALVRSGWYSSTGRTGGTWRRAAAQTINNNALTAILWDTEDFDSDGFLTPTASPITVPAGLGGVYMVTVSIVYATTALGANAVRIAFSGITDPYENPGAVLNGYQMVTVGPIPIAAASTIIVSTTHNNGVAQNVSRSRVDLLRLSA